MISNKKWVLGSICLAILAACGGGSTSANNAASASQEQKMAENTVTNGKVLRVTLEPVYPPFIQRNATGFEGMDVEILNAIAQKEGFRVQYIPNLWELVLSDVEEGKADVAIGGVNITDDRKLRLDFTESYYDVHPSLLVDKTSNISNFADAKGKTIVFQAGTATEALMRSTLPNIGSEVKVESPWAGMKMMMEKKADAMWGDDAPMLHYMNQYKDYGFKIIELDSYHAPIAFAVKKGNTELLTKLNNGLAAMKADGTLESIRKKWVVNSAH